MTAPWIRKLVAQVLAGQPTPLLEYHLDDVLIWLGNARYEITQELDHAFARAGLSRDDAVARAQTLLDRRLFDEGFPPHRILGLPPDAATAIVRQRYRRLIQAFHPDRQPQRSVWLTRRTELINIAYGRLRRRPPSDRQASTSARESKASSKRWSQRWLRTRPLYFRRNDGASNRPVIGRLRAWLGASQSFQWRFFGLLITGCLILLLYLLYANAYRLAGFEQTTSNGPPAHHSEMQTAPKTTVPTMRDVKSSDTAPATLVESH